MTSRKGKPQGFSFPLSSRKGSRKASSCGFSLGQGKAEALPLRKASAFACDGFRLPASGFRLPASGFRLPASGFRLPTGREV